MSNSFSRRVLVKFLDFLEALITKYIPVGFRILLLLIGSYAVSSAVVVCFFLILPFRTSANANIAIVLCFWLVVFVLMLKYVSSRYLLGRVFIACLLSFSLTEGSINALRRKNLLFKIEEQLKNAPVSVVVAEDKIDVMTEPSPDRSASNKVLYSIYKDNSEIVEKKWSTPDYTVYQLKFENGKTGYIFSKDSFREIEKPK